MMRVGIAADHGGFALKEQVAEWLRGLKFEVADFGAHELNPGDDDMNVFCLGGKVIGSALALELIETFLAARFSGAERHRRRLTKVARLEDLQSETR